MQKPLLSGSSLQRFESIQDCLVPRARVFSPEERSKSRKLVNDLMQDKPHVIHKKIRLFLYVIDIFSVLCGLQTFKNLDHKRQRRVMNFFFNSPFPLLRKGFWGLNTLCKLGVYGQDFMYEEIGYKLRRRV